MTPRLSRLTLSALTAALALALSPAASAKDVVKIAFIGPLTGANSAHGLGGRNSAETAVRLHNADPKSKYDFELVALDDECKPNVGVQVATKAATDSSIAAVIPHYCSSVAIATVDVYKRFKVPTVVWAAVLPEIIYGQKTREMHRVSATLINQNKVAAQWLTGPMKFGKWVAVYDTTDYGKSMFKYFSQYLADNKGEMLASFGVGADQQDFSAELARIKELKPEVVYFGGLTPLGVRLAKQMEKFGIKAVFQGTSGIVGDAFIAGLGAAAAEGTVAMYDMPPIEKLPGGKAFLDAYAAQKFGEAPEAYGPYAFAATALVMDSIEKSGPKRPALIDALGKVKDYDSVVGKITFDDYGQNINPTTTKYVVQDGKWLAWEDSEYASGKRHLAGR
ncbi:branched-chain amino acid ABC transporter substrate-binding protein [Derxia lacustris]|uniref:branched-chain amino acid ABC transporter substrate-binding protein n=1 Tax=Derxia lacustris TaxID=764842 RepID=UPI000A174BA9|nr:branched-chain amino acid ABC transporter substrate-binding protein [Derxia lacustris]